MVKKATENGTPSTMLYLGNPYIERTVIEKSPEKDVAWYTKVAQWRDIVNMEQKQIEKDRSYRIMDSNYLTLR